jgi:hypothetical protein
MYKTIMIAAPALGLTMTGVQAAPDHPCRAELQRLVADYSAIGFQDVVKPGQAHVRGLAGHDHTGGQIGYMQAQMRQARIDCEAGKVQVVRERVASVRVALQMTRG